MTLAYREAGPADGPVALLVHGFPQSSYMWRAVMPALAGAGWRGLAPDLAGFGDSPVDPPGTWERQVEALDEVLGGFEPAIGCERADDARGGARQVDAGEGIGVAGQTLIDKPVDKPTLAAGVATSGYYVRTAASPTPHELADFLDDLPAPEAEAAGA